MLDATPLLKLYAKMRREKLDRMDPLMVQKEQLQKMVRQAGPTRFGRDHDFVRINGIADFQAAVPLRRYEDFWEEYWKDAFPRLTDITWLGTVPYFAVTSGTTGDVTKYIPITRAMLRSNTRAGLDLLTHHVRNRPGSRIMGGRNFMLGGSTDLEEKAPGIFAGDLSGIAAKEIPRWARRRYFPPLDLALIEDWEEKIEKLGRASLDADIRMIGGTPSWVLIFFERLQEIAGGRPLAEIYPNLEMLVHGGVNFAPYQERFAELLSGTGAEMREVYPASEGFIASADRGYGEGLRLNLDNGIFYEFVPVEELDSERPTRHWLGNMEEGVNYAVILSSCTGVWGYRLGDTVKLVSRTPPRILITGRTAYTLSAFGEHLIGEEIEESVSAAAQAAGATVTDYSVGALYPRKKGELGGHLFVVEFDPPLGQDGQKTFLETLDRKLAETNEDYAAHRSGGFGMKAPVLHAVEPGTFAAWMKKRGKLGGQHKVPRVINDTALFEDLQSFTGWKRD